jgi:hypothetical protein
MCAHKHQNIEERISLARHLKPQLRGQPVCVADAAASENESDLVATYTSNLTPYPIPLTDFPGGFAAKHDDLAKDKTNPTAPSTVTS